MIIINSTLLDMEEEKVLERLKEGEHEAFTQLYNAYWNQVYNFSRLYVSSVEDCKEIVQQVFVKVWEARTLIKEKENFRGFLFIITRNIVFNLSKKSFNESFYKMSVLSAFSDSMEQANCDVEEEIMASQLNDYINQLVDSLPARQKEVFVLSRQHHLSHKEIVSRLDISEKTVEQHIYKVLKFLKENLQLFTIFLAC